MIEATTPTIRLKLPDTVDLTEVNTLFATFKQQSIKITKTFDNGAELIAPNIIAVTLTQEETLRFVPKFCVEVQVNWMFNGVRCATKKKSLHVLENLIPEVIT